MQDDQNSTPEEEPAKDVDIVSVSKEDMDAIPTPPIDRIEVGGIEDEMRTAYLDYAMSVIVGRALPDVRDGLKPVHRRVLYTMHEAGLQPNRPYRKSARVVGDCFVAGTLVHTVDGLRPIE